MTSELAHDIRGIVRSLNGRIGKDINPTLSLAADVIDAVGEIHQPLYERLARVAVAAMAERVAEGSAEGNTSDE